MNSHWAEQYAKQRMGELRREALGGQLLRAANATPEAHAPLPSILSRLAGKLTTLASRSLRPLARTR